MRKKNLGIWQHEIDFPNFRSRAVLPVALATSSCFIFVVAASLKYKKVLGSNKIDHFICKLLP